jgi:hypothetical protein
MLSRSVVVLMRRSVEVEWDKWHGHADDSLKDSQQSQKRFHQFVLLLIESEKIDGARELGACTVCEHVRKGAHVIEEDGGCVADKLDLDPQLDLLMLMVARGDDDSVGDVVPCAIDSKYTLQKIAIASRNETRTG